MLSKILLTTAVVIVAFFFIRQRSMAEGAAVKADSAAAAEQTQSNDLRFMAYAFLVMVLGLAAAMYYFQWRDDHTVLTISLYSDNRAAPISYQVYRYQLRDRSFTTIDGTNITVASSERMEIEGLNE
ncbi:MAG: hypothetical protein RL120_15965 [Gammaproteobacteria bacterium]